MGFYLEDGKLEINQDEVDVIQFIYASYLEGKNSREIAATLNDQNVLQRKWRREMVDYILKNERYAGNALLQKRYTTDTFPFEKKRNGGERPMYFVENSNPPVASKETFEQAQLVRKKRLHKEQITHNEKCLVGKIQCGCCRSVYRYKCVNGINYWICTRHDESKELCPIKPVAGKEIISAFLRLYYNLKHHGISIFEEIISQLQTIRSRRMLWSEDVVELNRQISDLSSQNQMLAELKQQGLIDPDIFICQSNEIAGQLREAKQKKERLIDREGDHTIQQTRDMIEILESGPEFLDIFDEVLFSELVEKIIVESNEKIWFRLKNGLELPEAIERTVR